MKITVKRMNKTTKNSKIHFITHFYREFLLSLELLLFILSNTSRTFLAVVTSLQNFCLLDRILKRLIFFQGELLHIKFG